MTNKCAVVLGGAHKVCPARRKSGDRYFPGVGVSLCPEALPCIADGVVLSRVRQ
jgi:hypothetical protein